jgi:hypothetical protein
MLTAGCAGEQGPPPYRDGEGFHFTPPPGWVERARADAAPGGPQASRSHRPTHQNLPLPPLGQSPTLARERLLVRYDRLTAGRLGWLRVTVADVSEAAAPTACLVGPGPGWRPDAAAETLEVGGLPAGRVGFRGRWEEQEYLCESVAVRKAGRVYLITASFPAADDAARAQVRRAVDGAAWQ